MSKLQRTILMSVIVLPALAGCGQKTVTVPPPIETPPPSVVEPTHPNTVPLVLAANVTTLNIYDERSGVGEPGRILHMPESAIVGKKWDLKPELLDSHRAIIDSEIRANFEPGENSVEIDVYVLDGYQSFVAREDLRELVQVRFGLRIEVGNTQRVHEVWIGQGEDVIEIDDLEVTRHWVDDNYTLAIRQSIRKAFEQIKEIR